MIIVTIVTSDRFIRNAVSTTQSHDRSHVKTNPLSQTAVHFGLMNETGRRVDRLTKRFIG